MAELPERLRAAADAHRPDRERMLARVQRGMAPDGPGRSRRWDPPAAPWARVVAVTAAVAGAVGLGGLAMGAVGGEGQPEHSVVTSSDSTAAGTPPPPAASGTSGAATSHPRAGTPAQPEHRTSAPPPTTGGTLQAPPAAPHPGASTTPASEPDPAATTPSPPSSAPAAPDAGGVTGSGSVDGQSNSYWSQSDVRVTVSRQLTSLTVELRLAATAGATPTGQFCTAPGRFTATHGVEGDLLVYRWVFEPGQTLAPGTYTFAGQFNHAPGRRTTSGDSWTVTGGGAAGRATANGGF